MYLAKRSRLLIFGTLFGAWMGFIYAYVSQAINWIFLPEISIAPPDGGLAVYVGQYLLIGAILGLVSAIPENRVAGMVLGGLVSTILLTAATLTRAYENGVLSSTILLMTCSFMPLVVLLAPIALLIRAGMDAQQVPKDQPYLWARRFFIPMVLTLVAVALGSLSLFSKDHRLAIQKVNDYIIKGQQATDVENLPIPLSDVTGFMENAVGPYNLTWSDRVDTFFGPRPVGSELSQFLVIARFENGFAFACVFSSNRDTPNCALY